MQSSVSRDEVVGASPLDPKQVLRILLRRRWLILAVTVAVVGAVAIWTLRQPRIYAAQTSVIIDVSAPRFLDRDVQDVNSESYSNYWYNKEYYETQNKVIISRAVSRRVVEKLGLQNDLAFLGLDKVKDEQQRAEALRRVDPVQKLIQMIQVKPVKDSRLVYIQVEDRDPKRAALLANEVADSYIQENLSLKLKTTATATLWLDEQRAKLEVKSKESELALYDQKKVSDLLTTSLEDRASIVSQRLNAISQGLTEVRLKMASLQARVATIRAVQQQAEKDHGPRWAEALPSANENNLVQQFKMRVANQGLECAELQERYLPDHPKLVACNEKLRAAEKDLLRELGNIVIAAEAELREATAKEKNLASLLSEAKSEAFEVNKKQIEIEELKREADNNRRLYDLVLKRLKDIELSGLMRTSNVRVLDAALPSLSPVRPNVRTALILALLVGLLGGFGLAMLIETMDSSVVSQQDIEERVGIPFLGFIPTVQQEAKVAGKSVDLHIHHEPKSSVAECCRAVRTNLLFMSPDQPFKTMLVTSSGPQEGKSTTVINLGIAMAQSGSRVLLMDTDMRRPRLHKAFGVPNDAGVSSVIVGETKLENSVKSTEVPGLFVLPCGPIPPNPAELLHTEAFAELLKQLGERYDRIILDSPPIGPVADAAVLSTRANGVLMVLKGGATHREVAKRAVRSLQDVNARIFGAVLNNINIADSKYDYYYYYGRYGYYYGEKPEKAKAS